MKDEIKVTANYSFWRHPIKWFKERKMRRFLQIMVNRQWKNGLKEEVEQMQEDMFLYGGSIMKGGHRVDPTRFR